MTSKTQAKREVNRRKGIFCKAAYKMAEGTTLTVDRAARQIALSDGTFGLSTIELRSVLGGEEVKSTPRATAKKSTTAKATTKAKAKPAADPEKAEAWSRAIAICESEGIDATGPKGGPTPEFWTVYKAVRADQRTQAAKAA